MQTEAIVLADRLGVMPPHTSACGYKELIRITGERARFQKSGVANFSLSVVLKAEMSASGR
jgi:hypothetical protein